MNKLTQPASTPLAFPTLITPRLLLREFSLEDIPAVFSILNREDLNTYLETDTLQSIADAEARVRSRMGLFHDGMGVRWAIALIENSSEVIGSCGYFSVRRGTQTFEIGFELHPDFWRKGIMTEALQAVISFAFSAYLPIPVHRMEALVIPENIASIRVLEKFSFECEGRRREFGFWKGRYQDVFLYALLNPMS